MFEELQKLMKPHTDKIVQEKTVTYIESMVRKLGVSLEEACDVVGMSVEEFRKVKEDLKKKEEDSVDEEEEKENTADSYSFNIGRD